MAVDCPSGKTGYPSQEAARRAALAIRRQRRTSYGKATRNATWYHCPDCGEWHTSSYRKHSGRVK